LGFFFLLADVGGGGGAESFLLSEAEGWGDGGFMFVF
jgi:hypothetical protein